VVEGKAYTASQVRTTSRSWDEGVLTDLCLTLYTANMYKFYVLATQRLPAFCMYLRTKKDYCSIRH